MRMRDILREDAAADLRMHAMASQAASMVGAYLHAGGVPVRVNLDANYYAVTAEEVGWTREFGIDDVLVGFGKLNPDAIGVSASLGEFSQEVLDCTSGILIDCLPTLNRKLVAKFANSAVVIGVLRHEFIHYLDIIRTKGKAIDRPSQAGDALAYRADPDAFDMAYYNDPAEFNAYYHDLASKLMSFIDKARGRDPDEVREIAEVFEIDADFKKTLVALGGHDLSIRRFFQWLTDARLKRLFGRLYKLHQEAVALL